MSDNEPSPRDQYTKHLEEATKNVAAVKREHGNAAVSAYQKIAEEFKKLPSDPKKVDQKAVYNLLKKASISYKQEMKILGKDVNDEFELGDVISIMKAKGLDPADVINRFQAGEGREVIELLMDTYQQKHVQGRHATWYFNKIGTNYDLRGTLAKGYKEHHKSRQHVAKIGEDLEHKLLQKASQQAAE